MFGSKLPRYAAEKMKLLPVQAVFKSTVTHCVDPVVFVNVYES